MRILYGSRKHFFEADNVRKNLDSDITTRPVYVEWNETNKEYDILYTVHHPSIPSTRDDPSYKTNDSYEAWEEI